MYGSQKNILNKIFKENLRTTVAKYLTDHKFKYLYHEFLQVNGKRKETTYRGITYNKKYFKLF